MKKFFKNYNEYKTTGIGLIVGIFAGVLLYKGKISGETFSALLGSVLILLKINDQSFTAKK